MKQNKIIWDGKELTWSGDGKTFLRGVGEYFLNHPSFIEAYNKILSDYQPKKYYQTCLFLPCSYGKPYSQSYIHYMIIKCLKNLKEKYKKIHQVILSNAGIVPRELEEYYPFCCYDWNPKFENPKIKEFYSKVLCKRLVSYILKFRKYYNKYACYLRWNSDSYKAVEMVEQQINLKISNFSLKSKDIPISEIEEIYNSCPEEDLILISPTNLKNLIQKLNEVCM